LLTIRLVSIDDEQCEVVDCHVDVSSVWALLCRNDSAVTDSGLSYLRYILGQRNGNPPRIGSVWREEQPKTVTVTVESPHSHTVFHMRRRLKIGLRPFERHIQARKDVILSSSVTAPAQESVGRVHCPVK
jgi:hypothetical protein